MVLVVLVVGFWLLVVAVVAELMTVGLPLLFLSLVATFSPYAGRPRLFILFFALPSIFLILEQSMGGLSYLQVGQQCRQQQL